MQLVDQLAEDDPVGQCLPQVLRQTDVQPGLNGLEKGGGERGGECEAANVVGGW